MKTLRLQRLTATSLAALALGIVALTHPCDALGQEGPGQDGEFSVQRFEPVPGPRNFMSVAGGRTDGEFTWSSALMFDYQRDPFVVKSCFSETNCDAANATQREDTAVVSDMLTWNLLASITPIPIIQVGLRVPVAFVSGAGMDFEGPTAGGGSGEGIKGAGLGDIALEGKVRIWGEPKDPIVFAAALDVAAPLGHATAEGKYIGNRTPITVGGRGIVDLKLDGFTAAANLRGIYRQDSTFGDTTIGPEFRWGVAAGYQFHEMFRGIAEGYGATRFSDVNGTNSVEIDGGIQVLPLEGRLIITAAGGTGLVKGIGVPIARAIFGVAFHYEALNDDDGDGIPNDEDQCPTKAEDRDGIADSDGCPEDDFDHDNIPDELDNCPLEPETENGYQDDDGCPDVAADKDGDGIMDDRDKCPEAPGKMTRPEHFGCPDSDQDGVPDHLDQCNGKKEDTDGFQDTDGCPDPDNDGDGVLDGMDECADEAEIMNGVDDTDGCPDFGPDADDDGIDDSKDDCPGRPETYNGNADTDGCPDVGGTLVRVNPKAISAQVPIRFRGSKIADPTTRKALDGLAAALTNWAAISSVEVLVTTTAAEAAQGRPRADAVVAYLVSKGVAKKRLVAQSATGAAAGVAFKVLKAPKWK